MSVQIDEERKTLTIESDGERRELDLYGQEAFERLSELWLKLGWNQKYTYTFSWLGRPIIQLPEDMIRTQEVVWQVQPDVIVETGIAHGGSLIYSASLLKMIGKGDGRVVGIDIDIREHNRKAIEAHPLFPMLTLFEGSSTDPAIVDRVKAQIKPNDRVLVMLDSNHSRQHVLDELNAYHELVTPGSYIVATDGVMRDLTEVPRGDASWGRDNPCEAVREFLAEHDEFVCEQPPWPFNESELSQNLTHWPDAWLRRR